MYSQWDKVGPYGVAVRSVQNIVKGVYQVQNNNG